MKHIGNIRSGEHPQDYLDTVTEVTGDIRAYQGATVSLPLADTTGDIWASQGATVSLPLAETTGDILADQGATVSLPLTETTGDIWAYQGATVSLPLAETTGNIRADQGATVSLPLAETTGDIRADQGATVDAPNVASKIHTTIATDGEYFLMRSPCGTYVAGCRGPFVAADALAHWDRTDNRAVIFTAAIKKAEGMA